MKKNENITINKYNYKGYLELYKFQKWQKRNKEEKISKIENNFLLAICISFLISFSFFILNIPFITKIVCLVSGLTAPIIGIKLQINISKIEKEQIKEYEKFKKIYFYVDTDIDNDVLKKALIDAKVIKYELVDEKNYIENNVRENEDYLKAEEIKENYLNETKYERYIVNPGIEEEELKKVKVKSLSLTR